MNDLRGIIDRQNRFFKGNSTLPFEFRIRQLERLKKGIEESEDRILDALNRDLGKCAFESYETEVGLVVAELNHAIKNLENWMDIYRVKTPFYHFKSVSYIKRDPYGVALIISPWSNPFSTAMVPLIASISAGNCSIIKPSSKAARTSEIIAELIEKYFDEEYIAVLKGGREDNNLMLNERYDCIFFTGSDQTGRYVMRKAARHLTPTILQLSGKNPCIVHGDCDIDIAAKRIAWGKLLNSGQSCTAPDYILVHEKIKSEFLEKLVDNIIGFYGDNAFESESYGRIVDERNLSRLNSHVQNGDIYYGGKADFVNLRMEPTVMKNVSWEDKIMSEEVFGPIFPIIPYRDINEVIDKIKERKSPLAMYLFTEDENLEEKILEEVRFGGIAINDTMIQAASPYLPFGGVGDSGNGRSNGKAGFDAFTYEKGIIKKSNSIDLNLRYAPYKKKLSKLKSFLK